MAAPKRPPSNPPTPRSVAASVLGADLPISEEQIRRRAYEIYLARGRTPGDPVADWLQAERELRTGAASKVRR